MPDRRLDRRSLTQRIYRRGLLAVVAVLALGLTGGSSYAAELAPDSAPAPAAVADAYTWRNVEIVGGGFVTGIVYNRTEPGLVYARTDMGGAYRKGPGDAEWVPLTDWLSAADYNLLGIESLATDPVDPDRVYLAAGTYTQSWASNGAILRSTDRGGTWKRTDMPFKMGGNMPGRSIGERLRIDPNKHNVLYFCSRDNGLWKSTDFGETWHRVESFPVTGMSGIGISFVFFDASSGSAGSVSQTIYVGVASKDDHLYRSTDGGRTWEAVPGQPTGFIPHHGALTPDGTLYLTYGDQTGPYTMTDGAVRTYDTDTGTWIDITPVDDPYHGFGGLAVDAQNPDTVMVTSMGRWWPDAEIYRSTDGGESWTTLGEEQVLDVSTSPFLNWGGEPKSGWMIGDIAIDPFNSDRAMYVTGATVYGTSDVTDADAGGATHWSVAAEGIEQTSVQDLISPPSGPHLISGLGDIGGFRHDDLTVSPRAGMSSNPIFTTTSSLDYAEKDPSVVARVGTGDDIMHAAYSTDGGATWTPVSSEPAGGQSGGGRIAVSADGSTFVWTPEGGSAHYSRDHGATWTASSGLPAQVRVASDRVDPDTFYAFDPNSGTFYVSDDGGASFAATAENLPTGYGKWNAVPDRAGHVWLATSEGGLFRSTNRGASFTKVAAVAGAETIGFGKAAPERSYMALYMVGNVSGVQGVFRSVDAGQSWVRINDDQHQYGWIGQTISGDPCVFGRAYFGTNGRGIVYGDTSSAPGPQPDTQPPSAPSGLQVENVSSDSVSLSWGASSDNVGVAGYDVYYGDGSRAGSASGASGTADGLSPETEYEFFVTASDAAGNESGPSGSVTVTTAAGAPEPDPSGECAVDYRVVSDWGSGFGATISITNTGDETMRSWGLEFDFPTGQRLNHGWSGHWSQSGSRVTVTSMSWNGVLDTGETVEIGFTASYTGGNPEPPAFSVNGATCTTG